MSGVAPEGCNSSSVNRLDTLPLIPWIPSSFSIITWLALQYILLDSSSFVNNPCASHLLAGCRKSTMPRTRRRSPSPGLWVWVGGHTSSVLGVHKGPTLILIAPHHIELILIFLETQDIFNNTHSHRKQRHVHQNSWRALSAKTGVCHNPRGDTQILITHSYMLG